MSRDAYSIASSLADKLSRQAMLTKEISHLQAEIDALAVAILPALGGQSGIYTAGPIHRAAVVRVEPRPGNYVLAALVPTVAALDLEFPDPPAESDDQPRSPDREGTDGD